MSAPQIPKRPAKIIVDQIMNRVPVRPVIFPVYRKKEIPARVPIFPVYRIGEKEIKEYLSSIYSSIPETTTSKWLREKCEEHFQVKIRMKSKQFHKIFREVDAEN